MKRFAYKILLFLLPVLLIFFFLEYSLRNIKSGYNTKRDGLIAQSNDIEILIVGNSHANYGINPQYFNKKAYNMAYVSQTILYDEQLILKYLPVLKNLKYVIISIDYFTLYAGFDETRDFFYYHYYGINLRNRSYFNQNLSYFFYVFSPAPAVKLLLNKAGDFFVNGDTFVNGWQGLDSTEHISLTEKSGKMKAEHFDDVINSSKEHNLIYSEFESLVQILKEKNITPVIVSAPCYKYVTQYLDNKILKENLSFVKKLKEKYNLVYLNSLNDTSFKAEDFYDCDHLNKYGSAKYSIQLNNLINSLH
jgi:hypothetical protein